MKRYRRGRIEIDVSELLDQVDDDYLIEECEARKLSTSNGVAVEFDEVERAYDYLKSRDYTEALLILERLVRPKWKTLADAEAAYNKETGREVGKRA